MLYKDLYACDLSLALAGGAIEAIDKPYCMACIYSALRTIHEFGLQHRYINGNSIYVTTTGVPKVIRIPCVSKINKLIFVFTFYCVCDC